MEPQPLQNALALVPVPQRVASHIAKHSLIKEAVSALIKIPEFQKLRMTMEITQHLALIVQHASELPVPDQDEIVLEVLARAFQLSDPEKETVAGQILFIRENRLAKKLTFVRRNRRFFFGWLGRLAGRR